MLVPPSGSADHINYAAYGRIAAQGGDPYVEAPAEWHGGTDPVTRAVEPPWTRTPSVYGPVATAIQAADQPARRRQPAGDRLGLAAGLRRVPGCWSGWLLCRFTAARAGDRSPAQSRAAVAVAAQPGAVRRRAGGRPRRPAGNGFRRWSRCCLLPGNRSGPAWRWGPPVGTKLTMLLAVPALVWAVCAAPPHGRLVRHLGLGLAGAAVVLVPAHLLGRTRTCSTSSGSRTASSRWPRPGGRSFDALKGPVGNNAMRHWVVVLTPVVVVLVALLLARIVRPAANLPPAGARRAAGPGARSRGGAGRQRRRSRAAWS